MYVYVGTYSSVTQETERGIRPPGAEVTRGCDPSDKCVGTKLGFNRFLNSEPSLQLPQLHFLN